MKVINYLTMPIETTLTTMNNEINKSKLSLRKAQIEQSIMKRRFTDISSSSLITLRDYTFNIEALNIPKEYIGKEFTYISDLFDFVIMLFNSKIDDYIYYGIALLKQNTKYDDYSLLCNLEIPNYLLMYLNEKNDNIKVVNEILWSMVNFTFGSNEKIGEIFTTEKFILCYNNLMKKYEHDMNIKCNLITLLGNLVAGDMKIQKIFFQSGIFNVILNIAKSNVLSQEKEISIWFIACFVGRIDKNIFFNDKEDVLLKCLELFMENIIYNKLTLYCLIGIEKVSESDKTKLIWSIVNNEKFMNYILSLPYQYIKEINTIICNLTSNEEEINLILINKYNILSFLDRILECQSVNLRGHAIWTLSNLANDKNQEILINLFIKGIIGKILALARDYNLLLVNSSIEFIVNLICAAEREIFSYLYGYGICGLFIELLAKNFDENILDKTLYGLYFLLDKAKKQYNDNQFVIECENKGAKELLTKIVFSSKGKSVAQKAQHILAVFFSNSLEQND